MRSHTLNPSASVVEGQTTVKVYFSMNCSIHDRHATLSMISLGTMVMLSQQLETGQPTRLHAEQLYALEPWYRAIGVERNAPANAMNGHNTLVIRCGVRRTSEHSSNDSPQFANVFWDYV